MYSPLMARDDPKRCYRTPEGRITWDPAEAGRRSAIERFAAKCRFDPLTGCVIWTGGKTSGQGNSAEYGSFWYEGRRHFAHRWAGVHIHGLDLDGVQAGHYCPAGPNTLCVEHVEPQTQAENMAEQIARLGPVGARQTSEQRQYWLFVTLGIEPEPEPAPRPDGFDVPFFEPPEWLRPYLPKPGDDCPF